jgi:hypothetical protein
MESPESYLRLTADIVRIFEILQYERYRDPYGAAVYLTSSLGRGGGCSTCTFGSLDGDYYHGRAQVYTLFGCGDPLTERYVTQSAITRLQEIQDRNPCAPEELITSY